MTSQSELTLATLRLTTTLKEFSIGMGKRDVLSYVTRCLMCQGIKDKRVKYSNKLQPLDIPQMKWENISMGFFTRLPKFEG